MLSCTVAALSVLPRVLLASMTTSGSNRDSNYQLICSLSIRTDKINVIESLYWLIHIYWFNYQPLVLLRTDVVLEY